MEENINVEEEIQENNVQVEEEMYSGGGDLSNYVKKRSEYKIDEHDYSTSIETEDIGIKMLSTENSGYTAIFNAMGSYDFARIEQEAYLGDNDSYIGMNSTENGTTIMISSANAENESLIYMTPTDTVITNVVTPEEERDAVNKSYVDGIVGDINSILATLTILEDISS